MLLNIDNNPRLVDGFSAIFVWNPRVSLLIFHFTPRALFSGNLPNVNISSETFFLLSSSGIDINTSSLLLVNLVRLKPPFAHNSLTFLIKYFTLVTVWKLFSVSSS